MRRSGFGSRLVVQLTENKEERKERFPVPHRHKFLPFEFLQIGVFVVVKRNNEKVSSRRQNFLFLVCLFARGDGDVYCKRILCV